MGGRVTSVNITEFTAALKKYRSAVRRDRKLSGQNVYKTLVHSRQLCGSKLLLEARIKDGVLEELGYSVSACSLGQATLAMAVEHAKGLTQDQVLHVLSQLEVLLKGESPIETLAWPEMAILKEGAALPSRHDSARLVFRALLELFEEEKKANK